MTAAEKQIYNTFLEVSKKINDKPFRYRKNFEKFDDEKFIIVNKLSNFFRKFEHINVKDFIEAPYFVYNENYFDLKFYLSPKAIKTYTLYHDNYLLNNPDSDQTLTKIKESFDFIKEYCKTHNIHLKEYINYCEHLSGNGSVYNTFLTHLKNRNINFYVLFAFSRLDSALKRIDREAIELYCPALNRLNYIRTKFYSSSKAKVLIKKIQEVLDK